MSKTFIQVEVGDELTEEQAAILLGRTVDYVKMRAATGTIPGARLAYGGWKMNTADFAEHFGLPMENAEGWDTVWEYGQCYMRTGKCEVCGREFTVRDGMNPSYCCKAHAELAGEEWR